MGRPSSGPARFGLGHLYQDHVDDLVKVLLLVCLAIIALIISEKRHPSISVRTMQVLCVPAAAASQPAPAASPPAMAVTGPERDADQGAPAHEDLQEMTLKRRRWVPERPAEQVPIALEGQRPQGP